MRSHSFLPLLVGTVFAANCPFMGGGGLSERDAGSDSTNDATQATKEYLAQFKLDDSQAYMTTDWGTPIDDQASLKAGSRGPTLMEDFAFRQKLQRFDHERVCCGNRHYQMIGTDPIYRYPKE